MREKLFFIIVMICIGFILLFCLRGVTGAPTSQDILKMNSEKQILFESSHERAPYALILSLVHDKKFNLSEELIPIAIPDLGYYENKAYIYFPPGLSLLAIPLFLLGNAIGLAQLLAFALIPLILLCATGVLYKICREVFNLSMAAALLALFIYTVGSISLVYATTLYQHHLTGLCILATFYCAWKYTASAKIQWAIAMWSMYGISLWIDYPNLILLTPIILYSVLHTFMMEKKIRLISPKSIMFVFSSLAFIMIVLGYAVYNFSQFDDIRGTTAKLISEHCTEKDNTSTIIAKKCEKPAHFELQRIPAGLRILLFSKERGLFVYNPIFLFSIAGLWLGRKKLTSVHSVLWGTIFIHFWLYASWENPWGGWAFGPRYLIPCLGILALYCGIFYEKNKANLFAKIMILFLGFYSSAISLLGALTTHTILTPIDAAKRNIEHTTFLYNVDFLLQNKSGSFVYNEFFPSLPLTYFYVFILGIIVLLLFFILFPVQSYTVKK